MTNNRRTPVGQSLETSVALLQQAFATFVKTDEEWKSSVKSTLTSVDNRIAVQNGNVARLTDRANRHDEHHGMDDKNLAERISQHKQMWDDRAESLIRKGVYLSAWKAGVWLIGTGVAGALMGKAGNMIGWW